MITPDLYFSQEQYQENNLISENYSPHDLPSTDENIVVEQNSKLGILLQTKLLEDKVINEIYNDH